MKKINKERIVIISIFVFVFIIAGFKAINTQNIEILNVETGSRVTLNDRGKTANIIKTVIDKCNKADLQFNALPVDYTVTFKNLVGKDKIYHLSFNYDKGCVYIIKNNIVYQIDEKESEELYLCQEFSYIYIKATAPTMKLKSDNKDLNLKKQYDWTYKKINDSFYEEVFDVNADNSVLNITDVSDLELEFGILPDKCGIRLYKNDEIIKVASTFDELFDGIQEDGQYHMEVEAEWDRKIGMCYHGTQCFDFTANIDFPSSMELSSTECYPGDILVLYTKNLNKGESIKLNCTATSKVGNGFSDGNQVVNFIPIPLDTAVGKYEVTCVVNEGQDDEYVQSEVFNVCEKQFKTRDLEVAESVEDISEYDDSMSKCLSELMEARKYSENKILWDGNFIMPCDGTVTAEYGEIRHIDDNSTPSRHLGIDIQSQTGTPVNASNAGVVKCACYFDLTGNTIIIDHGFGIFTTYYHLDSINVDLGQHVDKGQLIGSVGNSGFTSEPHLHFATSFYNKFFNSFQAIENF